MEYVQIVYFDSEFGRKTNLEERLCNTFKSMTSSVEISIVSYFARFSAYIQFKQCFAYNYLSIMNIVYP